MGTQLAKAEQPALLPELAPIAPSTPMTPMRLLEIALQNSAGIEIIERLKAIQDDEIRRRQEIEFNQAMNLAQERIGRIAADKDNSQTHSRYASYAALDRVIRPVYTAHGFALSFDTEESTKPEHVKVVCYITHRGGHKEKRAIDMPTDGKGAKGGDVMTKTHATGSAMRYGMRYLLTLIFNVAVGEDNDGNGAPRMDDLAVDEYLEAIKGSANLDELLTNYKEAYVKAGNAGDLAAQKAFIAAKDARKRELR